MILKHHALRFKPTRILIMIFLTYESKTGQKQVKTVLKQTFDSDSGGPTVDSFDIGPNFMTMTVDSDVTVTVCRKCPIF